MLSGESAFELVGVPQSGGSARVKQGAGQITESAIELGCSCAPIEYAPIRRGCNLGEEHPDRLFCTPELPVANTAEIADRRFRRHAAMGGLFTLGDHGGGL
jgi:hypothetical protein